jgi:hypothetical protein
MIMKTLRNSPTALQRFVRQEIYVEGEITNFLFDADGKTVYAEDNEGWKLITPTFESRKLEST